MAILQRHLSFRFLRPTLASLILLASPVHSLNCSSQKFSNNLYTNCTDLQTLNASGLTSPTYSSIVERNISFEVSESSVEYSGGSMKIFATVRLPKTMTEVNHVLQVGGSVTKGTPTRHEFQSGNFEVLGEITTAVRASC